MEIISYISRIANIGKVDSNVKTYIIVERKDWRELKWIKQKIGEISWCHEVDDRENCQFQRGSSVGIIYIRS